MDKVQIETRAAFEELGSKYATEVKYRQDTYTTVVIQEKYDEVVQDCIIDIVQKKVLEEELEHTELHANRVVLVWGEPSSPWMVSTDPLALNIAKSMEKVGYVGLRKSKAMGKKLTRTRKLVRKGQESETVRTHQYVKKHPDAFAEAVYRNLPNRVAEYVKWVFLYVLGDENLCNTKTVTSPFETNPLSPKQMAEVVFYGIANMYAAEIAKAKAMKNEQIETQAEFDELISQHETDEKYRDDTFFMTVINKKYGGIVRRYIRDLVEKKALDEELENIGPFANCIMYLWAEPPSPWMVPKDPLVLNIAKSMKKIGYVGEGDQKRVTAHINSVRKAIKEGSDRKTDGRLQYIKNHPHTFAKAVYTKQLKPVVQYLEWVFVMVLGHENLCNTQTVTSPFKTNPLTPKQMAEIVFYGIAKMYAGEIKNAPNNNATLPDSDDESDVSPPKKVQRVGIYLR